ISDLKHMDSSIHKKYTGVGNDLILENLKKLSKKNVDIILRIPVIPGINDSMDNIKITADYILNDMNNKIKVLQLLSFMHLGEEKYKSLGMNYNMNNLDFNRKIFQNKIIEIQQYFISKGINCTIGTKEQN
ncbi:MAG: glycyl-radical enzyme activating protein, partial [Clostridium chrysemydis]